ncbi:MDR family MFS transporter [Inconstantimicrobium mannanitabidum]|uniref:MFS transporter n=1 Tax=Inconstantimicrobium mannanitabidum TaxID=1604901 RepID=A0ACB5RET8_9CLOT|nr:MFS transporter [Clostridium sp. TW13]GKX67294.1 MFS transporter [Clostridium sp. TW13]
MEHIKKCLNPYRGLSKEIYVLFFSRIINCIGGFVHPLMSLILTNKVGLSASEAGTFVTILAICQVPCTLIGGKMADSFGRKKIIVSFQILGAVVLMICGFFPVSTLTAVFLIISSCFYSLSGPAFDALNADITTAKNRQAAYSLLYMGVNVGFSIGPIIGGLLYANYLSLVFIGDAITTLIALFLIVIFIKESKGRNVEEQKKENELEAEVEGSTLKVLLERPTILIFAFIILLYQFSYSQWGFALPIHLSNIFGSKDGAKLFGFLGACNGVVVILFTPVLVAATKKLSRVKVMALGGFLYTIAFAMFGMTKMIPVFFIGVIIMTIGEVLISINEGVFIADNTPASHRGRISSILPLIMGAGYALGPSITGRVIDHFGMYSAWMVTSLVVTVGAVAMFNLNRIKRK